MKNLFEELKRRKVFRVATVYLIATWLLIQVADTVFPILNLPDWSVRLITVFLLIGFPIAVILTWAFEVTPDGIKRNADVDPAQQNGNGRKTDFIIIAVLLLVIVIAGIERFVITDDEQAEVAVEDEVVTKDSVSDVAANSIAVLPFVNMSTDVENEYFSDGLSEELLNVLAKVDGLRVTSRTSSFAFKGQPIDIQTIAERLKVRHILEGSVRKSGNNLRITAQLIDTETDSHLWSDTYDRELENIFEIQDEISQNIVGELMSVLGRDIESVTVTVKAPTDNLEAYEEFLQGRHLFLRRQDDPLRDALGHLQRAVELDPEFERAWSQMASVYAVIADYRDDFNYAQTMPLATRAAERALALNPDNAEAYSVLAWNEAVTTRRYEPPLPYYEKAIELAPNDHQARLWLGIQYLSFGYVDKAVATLQQAFAVDPAVGIVNGWLGRAYDFDGQNDKAMLAYQRSADLGFVDGFTAQIEYALDRGDPETVAALEQQILAIDPTTFPGWMREVNEAIVKGQASAELLARMHAYRAEYPENDAMFFDQFVRLGAIDNALDVLQSTLPVDSAGFLVAYLWTGRYEAIVEHPRFLEMVAEIGIVEDWETHGYPDHCERVDDHLECDFP